MHHPQTPRLLIALACLWLCACALLCAPILSPQSAAADSPLTSTDFARPYADHPLITLASKASGTLDDTLCAALSDPSTPSDIRAAIINTLGWSIDGHDNAQIYLSFIARTHTKTPSDLSLSDLSPSETFSLGYLLAMDDYLSLSPLQIPSDLGKLSPQAILSDAMTKAPQDFTVALIHALVLAQSAMDSDWCQVFRAVEAVIKKPWPARNMKDEAVSIILDYVALYAPECANPRPVTGP